MSSSSLHNQNNDNSSLIVTTTLLTNPGIIDRLEQDINDYLSPFGYSLERQLNNERKSALLVAPHPSSEQTICTLHIHVHSESLIPTIGPLLRTYLRLSPSKISPMQLCAVVHCNNFILDPLERYDKMNALQRRELLEKQMELAAKRITQFVHIIVRNSMGSALCLNLVVILPCYWKRRVYQCNDDGMNASIEAESENDTITKDERERRPISVESVRQAMHDNPDANYPSVILVEQSDVNVGLCDDHTSCNQNTLHLDIISRMCTVRHQPLIFRWISTLHCPMTSNNNESHLCEDNHKQQQVVELQYEPCKLQSIPFIVACIEKVSNLHRILMICHDYDKRWNEHPEHSLMSKVIIILPNTAENQRDKTMSEFNDAIDNFHKVIIESESGDGHSDMYRPSFVYESNSVEKISEMIQQSQPGSSSSNRQSVVGIDLHPDALTLHGNYATNPNYSPALQQMKDANAILFGYESSGIPQEIANKLLNSWIQIPSRSSINVVAAMSIILDALLGTGADKAS